MGAGAGSAPAGPGLRLTARKPSGAWATWASWGPGAAHAASREPLTGPGGAVAADHELASRAGAEILAQGGNAVDAAVATALALGVVQPAGSGLGGGGFLVVRKPDGQSYALDFREVAPRAARADMYIDKVTGKAVAERSRTGALAVAVPGEPAGFAQALKEHGKLGATQVIAPALHLARDGFPVGGHLARAAAQVVPRLPANSSLRELLAPGGVTLVRGQVLKRPELAATLERIEREGFQAFYRTGPGTLGDEIVRAVREGGGILSAADLQAYRPVVRTPLVGQYRGYQLVTMPPPAGGVTALETLQILNARPPLTAGPGSSATLHELIEAFKHAFADRARLLGDPAFVKIPTAELTSLDYARGRAATIQPDRVLPAKDYGRPAGNQPISPPRDHGTTHICVIDRDGTVAALTSTVNLYFGAQLVGGKTGVILNDEMDDFAAQPAAPNAFGLVGEANNAVAPGKRPASSMTPLIAVGTDGTLLCAGGSGGPTIVTGVVQTVVNILDFKMDVEAAVGAPRIHAQYVPDNVLVEPEIPADVRAGLERRGHKLSVPGGSLGTSVQVVLRRPGAAPKAAPLGNSELEADPAPPPSKPQPTFSAASDPRKGGLPAVP
ncbi:MAG: gamma-glutamyltransferase [Polyangia bacterium]